jgi:hypothetical protein
MKHVSLGGLDVSRIGLGAMTMAGTYTGGGGLDDAESIRTLVGELSTQSELFRQHWASHNVKIPPQRPQTTPPSRRRRARPQLRGHGAPLRARPAPQPLHR